MIWKHSREYYEKDNYMLNAVKFPKACQIGVVVKNTKKTSEHLSNALGIGPWYRPNPKTMYEEHFLKGQEKIEVEDDILLAFSGPLQIELIEPKSIENDIYHEHLIRIGEGIHHLGFCVSNIDHNIRTLQSSGFDIIQTGMIKSGEGFGSSLTRYAYFNARNTGGIIIELIQTKLFGMSIPMSRFLFEVGCMLGDVVKA